MTKETLIALKCDFAWQNVVTDSRITGVSKLSQLINGYTLKSYRHKLVIYLYLDNGLITLLFGDGKIDFI